MASGTVKDRVEVDIPEEIRQRLGLESGALLRFEVDAMTVAGVHGGDFIVHSLEVGDAL